MEQLNKLNNNITKIKRFNILCVVSLFLGVTQPVISTEDNQKNDFTPEFSIPSRTGCGAGCHYRNKQLTSPEEHEDGWRRVKVKSEQWYWDYSTQDFIQGDPFKSRLEKLYPDEKFDGISTYWVYAQCNQKKVSFGHPSKARVFNAFRKDGNPNTGSVNGSAFDWYSGLCLEES